MVDSAASIGDDVVIGAYSVVEGDVEVGDGTWIGNHVNLRKGARIGQRCKVFHSAVIGEIPQDLKFGGAILWLTFTSPTIA